MGRRMLTAIRSYVGRSIGELSARVDALHKSIEQSLAQTPTLEIVRGEIDIALSKVESLAPAATLSIEDFRPMMESEIARGLLDLERRAQAVLERAVDRIPKPRDGIDGVNGKDGEPGIDGRHGIDGAPGGSVEDFDIAMDGRILTVSMKIGDRIERKTVRLDLAQYKDVYRAGEKYERGDMVTFGGSVFIATRDTTGSEKPESSTAWKLMVKRGRDGKDAE
jgi:hypothetical protein